MIGILNYNREIVEYLGKEFDVINLDNDMDSLLKGNPELILMNWISSSYNGNDRDKISNLLKQTLIISNNVQDLKIMIFDSSLSITDKELEWFSHQKNVFLFEPALNYRKNFQFLPSPVMPFSYESAEKSIDLCCDDDLYTRFVNEYSDCVLIKDIIDFHEIRFNLRKYSKIECEIGFIDDLNEILSSKCVPLIYDDHRFFHALFDELTIKTTKDIKYLIDCCRNLDTNIFIQDFYGRMEKYFPEMSVEYLIHLIKERLE
jgi:hypothetical protein